MADVSLRELVDRARLVLFDFDGPVCDVFAGVPAPKVARWLERHLPSKVDTDDPLAILQEAAKYGSDMVEAVEDDLIMAELKAVDKAVATPGGLESITATIASGRGAGILSNNSSQAIVRYLKDTGCLIKITPVMGRKYARPDLMKPNPYPFHAALIGTEWDASETLFIGDSLSDIEVAHAVGAPVVGYANKSGKADTFASAGASFVIEDMTEVTAAIVND
ncbi:HAD hydrolase-like protein [Amycolatopsis rhabdoformis]|uniref:HAD hydrolase-like protein n=1 Tax=Amycolatopsis rhabdoformis TaxID=1448059 RepID=A0ABZ1I0J3_9PSEU|nr:HAD hydrolase-like protein [Amycolatopsis rhabdoformis]WSE27922.1 HAD hydrolase-like protein [Amycolatopsis rhabdoformis]